MVIVLALVLALVLAPVLVLVLVMALVLVLSLVQLLVLALVLAQAVNHVQTNGSAFGRGGGNPFFGFPVVLCYPIGATVVCLI